jgi:hypothetical protein
VADMCMPSQLAGPTLAFGNRCRSAAWAAADWLCFAATPTFAVMGLLTTFHGGGMPEMLCAAGHTGWPLGGMATMYLLMSVFHLAPWLKLLPGRHVRRPPPPVRLGPLKGSGNA